MTDHEPSESELILMKELVTAYSLLKQTSKVLARHQFSQESPQCITCCGEVGSDAGPKCTYSADYVLYEKIVEFMDNLCLAYNLTEQNNG